MLASFLSILTLVSLSATMSVDDNELEFIKMLEVMRSSIPDFELQYEGYTKRNPNDSSSVFVSTASGVFVSRHDGSYLTEIFNRKRPTQLLEKEGVLVSKGETRVYRGLDDRPRDSALTIKKTHPGDFFRSGTFNQAMIFDWMLSLLKFNNRLVEFIGDEDCDGFKCKVVQITLGGLKTKADPDGLSNKFWIDLEKYGQPRKVEVLNSAGEAQSRVIVHGFFNILFDGRNIPLPSSSTFDSYVGYDVNQKRFTVLKDANYRTHVYVTKNTCKPCKPIPDSSFNLKFTDGIAVNDQIRDLKYEFSHSQSPPIKQAPRSKTANLTEIASKLRIADEQHEELLQSAGNNSLSWNSYHIISVTFITLSTLGLLIALFLKLRTYS